MGLEAPGPLASVTDLSKQHATAVHHHSAGPGFIPRESVRNKVPRGLFTSLQATDLAFPPHAPSETAACAVRRSTGTGACAVRCAVRDGAGTFYLGEPSIKLRNCRDALWQGTGGECVPQELTF